MASPLIVTLEKAFGPVAGARKSREWVRPPALSGQADPWWIWASIGVSVCKQYLFLCDMVGICAEEKCWGTRHNHVTLWLHPMIIPLLLVCKKLKIATAFLTFLPKGQRCCFSFAVSFKTFGMNFPLPGGLTMSLQIQVPFATSRVHFSEHTSLYRRKGSVD